MNMRAEPCQPSMLRVVGPGWFDTGSLAGVNITMPCSWATHEQKVMP